MRPELVILILVGHESGFFLHVTVDWHSHGFSELVLLQTKCNHI